MGPAVEAGSVFLLGKELALDTIRSQVLSSALGKMSMGDVHRFSKEVVSSLGGGISSPVSAAFSKQSEFRKFNDDDTLFSVETARVGDGLIIQELDDLNARLTELEIVKQAELAPLLKVKEFIEQDGALVGTLVETETLKTSTLDKIKEFVKEKRKAPGTAFTGQLEKLEKAVETVEQSKLEDATFKGQLGKLMGKLTELKGKAERLETELAEIKKIRELGKQLGQKLEALGPEELMGLDTISELGRRLDEITELRILREVKVDLAENLKKVPTIGPEKLKKLETLKTPEEVKEFVDKDWLVKRTIGDKNKKKLEKLVESSKLERLERLERLAESGEKLEKLGVRELLGIKELIEDKKKQGRKELEKVKEPVGKLEARLAELELGIKTLEGEHGLAAIKTVLENAMATTKSRGWAHYLNDLQTVKQKKDAVRELLAAEKIRTWAEYINSLGRDERKLMPHWASTPYYSIIYWAECLLMRLHSAHILLAVHHFKEVIVVLGDAKLVS